MVPTYGLTHINLAVADVERSLRFYQQMFGAREIYRKSGVVMAQTPGSHDVIAFEERGQRRAEMGTIAHFGFRLVDAADIDRAVAQVEQAGGRLLRRGEHAPGLPFAYVAYPDGYEIEIWFE